ncbi:peroxisomal biogenesis factor 3 [Hordeum vulgare]|nr:peroxisomal biogenesis factor 3 [Hordeum vulgare]
MHCTMTIGEARAHYMDMVREERQEQFQKARVTAAYNHHLFQEHQQAEEHLSVGRVIMLESDLVEQAMLLESYTLCATSTSPVSFIANVRHN